MLEICRPSLILFSLAMVFASGPAAAQAGNQPSPSQAEYSTPATTMTPISSAEVADQFVKLTGVAITPVLGMTVIGAASWLRTPEPDRSNLPWYSHPLFWGVGITLILVVWVGHRAPVIKRGFKAYKVWESKIAGLLGFVVAQDALPPHIKKEISSTLGGIAVSMLDWTIPSAHASTTAGAVDASSGGSLWWVLVLSVSVFAYAVIWLMFHTISVLAVISPFGWVDWILKGFKLGALLLLMAAMMISPWASLAVCSLYVLIGALVAGWAFRLMVFGAVFSWDALTFRWKRTVPIADEIKVFSGEGLKGVPVRTWGRLVREPDGLRFEYRGFLVLPVRHLQVRSPFVIGVGMASPVLLAAAKTERGGDIQMARFPPRYLSHSSALVRELGAIGERPTGIRKGVREAIDWVKSQVHREKKQAASLALE